MDLRRHLNTAVLAEKSLAIASSCDLQLFHDCLMRQPLFREVRYNFTEGTSDDAFIEAINPASFVWQADYAVLSVAEATKKLIHPLVSIKSINPDAVFDEIASKLRTVVARTMDSPVSHAFLFKYPINRHALPPYEDRRGKRSVKYWLRQLDDLYCTLEEKNGAKVQVLDLEEALADVGFWPAHYRPELYGGHIEPAGAERLARLFLERLVATVDLAGKVKAIAIDLDNTLWEGVFLESNNPPRLHALRVLTFHRLASLGIPLCIVSKNNPDDLPSIQRHIRESAPGFFRMIVDWRVSWGPKSVAIQQFADKLGISPDAIAFFDDSAFERGEVDFANLGVRTYDETEITRCEQYAEFCFRTLSTDAATRVDKYRANIARDQHEAQAAPTQSIEDYLKTLDLQISFSVSQRGDLDRIEELVQRTNQQNLLLNRTPRDIIAKYVSGGRCLMISLSDRFGDYGQIGAILYDVCDGGVVQLREMAISCRALGKKVEDAILVFLNAHFAELAEIRFRAEVNYRNQAFFDLVCSFGYVRDGEELVWRISSGLEYPPWFTVGTPRTDAIKA